MSDEEEEFLDEPSSQSSAVTALPIGQDPYVDYLQEQREAEESYSRYTRLPTYSSDLQAAFASYRDARDFAPGDLVEWKPMLKDRTFPFYGVPAVVISQLDQPSTNAEAGGDELSDLQIGYLDGSKVFRVSSVTSARLKIWDGF